MKILEETMKVLGRKLDGTMKDSGSLEKGFWKVLEETVMDLELVLDGTG